MSNSDAASPWLPEPDEHNAPYFSGLQRSVLCLQRCSACERWAFPFRRRCQRCGRDALEWRDASGFGAVYAHARLQRVYHPRHQGRLPLVLAWIDLDEGVRMVSNVVRSDSEEAPDKVSVGMRVEVCFEDIPGGRLPVFAAVESS